MNNAKHVANIIFEALSPETSYFLKERKELPNSEEKEQVLSLECFLPFFETTEEAEKAFEIFDIHKQKFLNHFAFVEAVKSIFTERKSLSATLRDTKSAVNKLDNVLMVPVVILSILLALIVYGVQIGTFLVSSLSLITAIIIMVGNSAKQMFEGLIFLFVIHPFDVGDRICIDGDTYVVKKMNILNTVFLKGDGQLFYYPNSLLVAKQFSNFNRSSNQLEVFQIEADFKTPISKLYDLKRELEDFIRSSNDFAPILDFRFVQIENLNSISIQIYLEHNSNWQDESKKGERHNKFGFHLKKVLENLDIVYKYPKQMIKIHDNIKKFT